MSAVGRSLRIVELERACASVPADALMPAGPIARWLGEVESRLRALELVDSSWVAIQRLRLIAAVRSSGEAGSERLIRLDLQARAIASEVTTNLSERASEERAALADWQASAAAAIAAAAGNQLLYRQGQRARATWLAELLQVMSSHPASRVHVVHLCAALSREDVLAVLDETFRDQFGV